MNLKTISLAAFALASLLLVIPSQIISVYADDRINSTTCSNATLNGPYGFFSTGTTSDGPYAAVGTLTFDGNGNCVRRQGVSRNGAFEKNHLSFQYEVAGNCTGKTLSDGQEFETFVIANDGNEIYLLKEGAQTTYLIAKKIHP